MSLGISLSQLIVDSSDPVASGIQGLDEAVEGFQPRAIYEIFGPPGSGKTRLGLQMMNIQAKKAKKVLWIDTHKTCSLEQLNNADSICYGRVQRFSHLVYMFQELGEEYSLVVIDGFSQLVTDYLNSNLKRVRSDSMHSFKNKNLTTILTLLTKYAHTHNSTVVLLNDAMNTSFQENADERFVAYSEESHFLVRSARRSNVQVLKSALVANAGVGNKDNLWEVFIRRRIGLFWDWIPATSRKSPPSRCPNKTRVAIVFDLAHKNETGAQRIVKFVINDAGLAGLAGDGGDGGDAVKSSFEVLSTLPEPVRPSPTPENPPESNSHNKRLRLNLSSTPKFQLYTSICTADPRVSSEGTQQQHQDQEDPDIVYDSQT
ncbi:LAMI_0H12200g1_1 [Lachancea mirantina]|uniref:LAMI_0H12200g1_1 n=1 Tax=Lachancea mirantina TaxID=1230905 RepID=A0A1G4KHH8_9SACH|nr:LAMI_0H12200g1_1 [Lachancea mirantina]